MSDNNLVAGQHEVVVVDARAHFSRSPEGLCGSKRRLKFRLRNTIFLFFSYVRFGQHILYVPKALWTLSQCCQQSNHRNFLKEPFFLFSCIRNISHDSSSLKDGRGKCTVIYFSIHVFVSSLVVGSYPNLPCKLSQLKAFIKPNPGPSLLLGGGGGGRRETLGTRFALNFFVTHAHHSKDSDPLLSSRALCLLDLQRK